MTTRVIVMPGWAPQASHGDGADMCHADLLEWRMQQSLFHPGEHEAVVAPGYVSRPCPHGIVFCTPDFPIEIAEAIAEGKLE